MRNKQEEKRLTSVNPLATIAPSEKFANAFQLAFKDDAFCQRSMASFRRNLTQEGATSFIDLVISEAQAFQLDEQQQSILLKDPKVTPALIQALEQAIKQSLVEKLKLAILRGLDSPVQPTHPGSYSTANYPGRKNAVGISIMGSTVTPDVESALFNCFLSGGKKGTRTRTKSEYKAHENNVCIPKTAPFQSVYVPRPSVGGLLGGPGPGLASGKVYGKICNYINAFF